MKSEMLVDIAIRRAMIIPAAEIYGSPAGFYDYGPVGCAIKRKIENLWRLEFLQKEGFHEIETTMILPEAVLRASGHAENFADPVVSCSICKGKFRADHLISDNKAAKKDGVNAEGLPKEKLSELLLKYEVRCPNGCKSQFSEVSYFNMMFRTAIGAGDDKVAYCRPETAQGIFIDFPRIVKTFGSKLPIGIGQVGRSFRNEISPRQGLIRMREFSQMELEYFFNPAVQSHPKFSEISGEKLRFCEEGGETREISLSAAVNGGLVPNEIMAYFLWKQQQFYLSMGIPREKFLFKKIAKEGTPHYSRGNIDLEVETSYGLIETIGTAYRTDFDLSSHSKASGTDLSVFIDEEKKKIMPHVVEPSMGVDRLFWCVLEHTFRAKSAEKEWDWFDLPPAIAPYHAWIFPLMKKDGMDAKARTIEEILRASGLTVYCQESGSIGRRYARADEIGVPYCITVDYDTLTDDTVTLRFRNDGKQVRMKIGELAGKIADFIREGKVTG